MIQAHKGYFKGDVQFFSVDSLLVKIPTEKQITILWDDEPVETKTKSQLQLEALERFVEANKALDEQGIEPLDDEFFEIVNSGISIRGVEL